MNEQLFCSNRIMTCVRGRVWSRAWVHVYYVCLDVRVCFFSFILCVCVFMRLCDCVFVCFCVFSCLWVYAFVCSSQWVNSIYRRWIRTRRPSVLPTYIVPGLSGACAHARSSMIVCEHVHTYLADCVFLRCCCFIYMQLCLCVCVFVCLCFVYMFASPFLCVCVFVSLQL